jgi:hypothetical protein
LIMNGRDADDLPSGLIAFPDRNAAGRRRAREQGEAFKLQKCRPCGEPG